MLLTIMVEGAPTNNALSSYTSIISTCTYRHFNKVQQNRFIKYSLLKFSPKLTSYSTNKKEQTLIWFLLFYNISILIKLRFLPFC